jgi:hypothetical protein
VVRYRTVWGFGLAVLLLGFSVTRATVRELLMESAGLDPAALSSTPSIRLLGMGDLSLSVPDESNELNTHDFGGSISGVLEDGERWVAESWLGNHRRTVEHADYGAERRYGHGGFQLIRRWPGRAMGADFEYSYFEDAESDAGWSKIRGPRLSGMFNQRIGPVTAGLILGRESEDEARITPDFFAIRHQQDRWLGQLGVETQCFGMRWGAAWDFERGDVVGKGIDAARFHEDTFTWTRPLNRYSFFALLKPRPGLEGGVRLRGLDRQGSERALVSWSGESPYNPSGTNYSAEAISFFEEESDWDVKTLWRAHGSGGMTVAAEAGYRAWDHRVDEGTEFKGSLRAGRAQRKIYSLGAGASRRVLAGRVLLALEGRGAIEDWVMEEPQPAAADGTSRRASVGAGLEFFATDRLMLRGGFSLFSEDQNIDRPVTLRTGNALSGGLSWVPRGGLLQVQAGVRHERAVPKEEISTNLEKTDETQFALGLRWLL